MTAFLGPTHSGQSATNIRGDEFEGPPAVKEINLGNRKLFMGSIRDIADVKAVEAKLVQNERLAAIGQVVAGRAKRFVSILLG